MSQRRFILSPTSDMDRAAPHPSGEPLASSAAARAHRGTIASAPSGMHVYLRADRTRAGPLCIHGSRPLARVSGRAHRAVGAVPIMPSSDSQIRTNVGARAEHTATDATRPSVDPSAPLALLTSVPHEVVLSSPHSGDVLPTTAPVAATEPSGAPATAASALPDQPRPPLNNESSDDDDANAALHSLAQMRMQTVSARIAHTAHTRHSDRGAQPRQRKQKNRRSAPTRTVTVPPPSIVFAQPQRPPIVRTARWPIEHAPVVAQRLPDAPLTVIAAVAQTVAALAAVVVRPPSGTIRWVVDSGATCHMVSPEYAGALAGRQSE